MTAGSRPLPDQGIEGVIGAEPGKVRFAGFTLDLAGHSAWDAAGREIPLSPAEFRLLSVFARNPRRALSRDQLLTMVAGREAESFDRSIDVLVGRVRRKIEPDPKRPGLIVTLPRVGYKFMAKPVPLEDDTAEPSAPSAVVAGDFPEQRQITVLACEFVQGPRSCSNEDLFELVLTYRSICEDHVGRLGGHVADVLGNQLIAYFGYPRATEHDAENAIRAGLAILKRLAGMTDDDPARWHARIGIATGLVMLGGLDHTPARAAVGEALGAALSIQARTNLDSVAVAAGTMRLTGGLFEYIENANAGSDGLGSSVASWRIIRDRSMMRTRYDSLRAETSPRFVGRQTEIGLLLDAWRLARAGSGRIALIGGDAGIGKSALCAEFSRRIEGRRPMRVRFQCSPHHRNSMLHPVVERIEQAAGFTADDTAGQLLCKLEALLATAPPLGPGAVPPIAALLAIPDDDRQFAADVSPAQRRRSMLSLLLDWLEILAERRPVLVLLEDAHWADAACLELIDLAAERIRRLPVMVVVTFRPELEISCAGSANTIAITPDPLPWGDATAMVEAMSEDQTLAPALIEQIVGRANGIPLHLRELTKAILRHDSAGGAEGDPTLADAIPATLRDLLQSRLDQAENGKEIIRAAAAIGKPFTYRQAACVIEPRGAALRSGLNSLVAAGVLQTGDTLGERHYAFTHALLRETAYSGLPRRERQGLHARIAGMLEAAFARDDREMPEVIAHHCREGALHEKAAEYWHLATQRSVAKGDLAGAIFHAKEALAALALLPDTAGRETLRIDRALALGGLLLTHLGLGTRQTQDAWAHAHALCQASGRPDLRARGMHGLFYALWMRSDFTRAEAVASDMLADATKQEEPNASMVAHRAAALAAFATGDFAKAIPHYEAAYGFWRSAVQTLGARPATMDLGGVLTMSGLCYSRLITGRPAAARNLVNEALRLARATENPYNITMALATACFVGLIRRKPAEILGVAEELEPLANVSGDKHWTRIAPLFLRWARCAKRGDAGDLETMERLLEAYRETGTPVHAPLYLSLLGEAYRWSGRVLDGLRTIETACALAEQTGERWNLPELWRMRGDLCLLQARPDREEARSCYDRGMALARVQGSRLWLLRCAARKTMLRALSRY